MDANEPGLVLQARPGASLSALHRLLERRSGVEWLSVRDGRAVVEVAAAVRAGSLMGLRRMDLHVMTTAGDLQVGQLAMMVMMMRSMMERREGGRGREQAIRETAA